MSQLSALLHDRRITPADSEAGQVDSTLADLKPGRRARIVDVRDDLAPAAARRLFDLGFTPGADVTVVRRAPMADPIVFRVAGCELALRRVQARCVRVCAVE